MVDVRWRYHGLCEQGKVSLDIHDKTAGFCLCRDLSYAWACAEVAQNKGLDTSLAQLFFYEEGLSVQCMHIGSYDGEPATIAHMETLAQELGYALDMDGPRKHHEIYLNDPRKTPIDKRKTIIRHPLR